jgi:hypothetical protein
MIIAVAILLTAGLFAYTLLVPREVEHRTEKTRVAYLRERRDVLYDNLRDLNFEHRAGKLPDADYESMRAAMEEEAALLLSEIESLENQRLDGVVPVSSLRSK